MTIPSHAIFVAGLVALIAFAAIKLIWGMALWAKRSDHRIGERFGDETVEVVEWSGEDGFVSAGGERWRATSKDRLRPGDAVVVKKVRGLTLDVRKG